MFSRFGISYTVVSDNGKKFVSKDLKEWLTAQGCYKSDTPLYAPRSNGLAESFNFQKAAWKLSTETSDDFWEHILTKFRLVIENLQTL